MQTNFSDLQICKLLVKSSKITQAQLDEASGYADSTEHLHICQMLIMMGCITPQDWQQAAIDVGNAT